MTPLPMNFQPLVMLQEMARTSQNARSIGTNNTITNDIITTCQGRHTFQTFRHGPDWQNRPCDRNCDAYRVGSDPALTDLVVYWGIGGIDHKTCTLPAETTLIHRGVPMPPGRRPDIACNGRK